MSTYRLDLAYDGTAYRGWARQPGQRTIEGEVRRALAMVLREEVTLSVAGRTDAGVHAMAQVVSFSTAAHVSCARLRLSLNSLLPPDVAVLEIGRVEPEFVARSARMRTYRYRLRASSVRPVFTRDFVWHPRGDLDSALLNEVAALLPGHRDFSALTPSARLYRTCVRDVRTAVWRPPSGEGESASEWVFEIAAGSFLHNMVRVAVGSMVDVAQGRMTVGQFAEGLDSGDRRLMGQTAPPRGLALVAVEY